LNKQNEATKKKTGAVLKALHRVKEMVPLVKSILENGDMPQMGELLHQNWIEKKCFSEGISNSYIDQCYDLALTQGAWGGKITGAGGGGFLLLCCPPEKQQAVAQALETLGVQQLFFSIDGSGARVLMNAGLRLTSLQPWVSPQKLLQRI
jgi:D-glycero-alpha-D-manno-heptose-7-phosphate kinase